VEKNPSGQAGGQASYADGNPLANRAMKVWEEAATVLIQGQSLKTWSYPSPDIERVQVVLTTNGRPLDVDVELWQGPDNTPMKMLVYNEDGKFRPFRTILETPRGQNTISIRNIAELEFPCKACVSAENIEYDQALALSKSNGQVIQGGALRTYPYDSDVSSVQVLLKTDGRPLNARIELLQGPNNVKQVIELYSEDGIDRPFYAIIETPESGNVVRIVNTATLEFPLTAWVQTYSIDQSSTGDIPSTLYGGGDVVKNRPGNNDPFIG